MSASGPLFACRNVSKYFGALAAVHDLSFEVAPGEVLGIGGPERRRQDDALEVISGFSPASAGEIAFDGRPITQLPPERICHAGIARTFQLNAGFDSLSVRDNVLIAAYFGAATGMPGLAIDRVTRERADAALAFVGLVDNAAAINRRPAGARSQAADARRRARHRSEAAADGRARRRPSIQGDDHVMRVIGKLGTRHHRHVIRACERSLVELSSRISSCITGEKIYEGNSGRLVRDSTVIDVYLGAGASPAVAGGDRVGKGRLARCRAAAARRFHLRRLSRPQRVAMRSPCSGRRGRSSPYRPNGHGKTRCSRVVRVSWA